METIKVETKAVNPLIGDKIPLPTYATEGSAAIDLRACIAEQVEIQPGETVFIGSGIAINIKDPNVVGIIAPRSGLGIKKGIVLANTIGVIDSDYQGEIQIGLFNRSKTVYLVKPGERICQMMFMPVIKAELNLVQDFSNETARGQGGFGHSGKI
ncbi:MAG: dUTP diphosphatase [Desulfobacterales bacterium]|nr:dUTP diphosphatase [Desulfobacterales bacterium]